MALACTQCGGPLMATSGQSFSITVVTEGCDAPLLGDVTQEHVESAWCGDCIDAFNDLVGDLGP